MPESTRMHGLHNRNAALPGHVGADYYCFARAPSDWSQSAVNGRRLLPLITGCWPHYIYLHCLHNFTVKGQLRCVSQLTYVLTDNCCWSLPRIPQLLSLTLFLVLFSSRRYEKRFSLVRICDNGRAQPHRNSRLSVELVKESLKSVSLRRKETRITCRLKTFLGYEDDTFPVRASFFHHLTSWM